MRDPFSEAELLPMLKNMLDDPVGAVEVKFSALGLICTLANSGTLLLLQHFSFSKAKFQTVPYGVLGYLYCTPLPIRFNNIDFLIKMFLRTNHLLLIIIFYINNHVIMIKCLSRSESS